MRNTHGLLAFTPRDFLTMMRNMGVESEFYETLDLDVSDRAKRDQEAFHENVQDTLKDHLTVEEFYKGVLEQNNRLQGARYQ